MPIDPSVDPLFDAAAQQYNLDPNVLRALHLTETGGTGRWDQTSPAGAQGGMQFIPSTAAKYGVRDPFDPQEAIPGAAHYLSDLLGDAEQKVGPGPAALTAALRNYNAGSPGHWNNPETAAYAGAVARYYAGLKSPPASSGDDAALRQQYDAAVARYPQTEGTYPGGYNSEEGSRRPPGETWEQYRARFSDVAPQRNSMNSIDQLAAAGQSNAPPPTQMAQAGGMSDDDLLNGFVNGTLPFLPKPGGAVPSGAAMPSGAPASPSAPAQPIGTPALDVPGLVDTYNRYRSFPAGVPLAQGALSILQKMAPEGYVLNNDGSIGLRPHYAQSANELKANEAAGSNLQTIGPNGVEPLPGAPLAAQTMANAKAEGEGQAQRVTQGVAPQAFRGAGSGAFYPPGSPVAPGILSAAQNGQTPEGTAIRPTGNGGVTVENTNPSSETIGKNFEELQKMEAGADAARYGLYQANLLKDRLGQIGTSGPATQALGELSAWAQQAGVKPETLKQFQLPAGATVEQANSLALGLLGEGLRATFPQRITNTDIATFRPSSPNANMLDEASKFLIDKVVVPKFARDVERYGYATSLPQNDPQEFKSALFKWDQQHPYSSFAQQEPLPSGASAQPTAPSGPSGTTSGGLKWRVIQ